MNTYNQFNTAETLNQKFALLTESCLHTKQAPKHPNLIDAIQFVTQSFIQAGFPNNDYHTKGIKDVCLWVSLCFPNIEKKVFMIYSLLIAYLSVVDDACDREVDLTGMLRRELREHEEFLEKESELSTIQNPSLRIAWQIKDAVGKQFTAEKTERVIDGCKEFFKCSNSIAEMWVSGNSPSLETFEKIRQVDSMANILLELSLVISSDNSVPVPSFFSNDLSIHGYNLATRCCTIINDVASIGKDVEDGITNNYVLLLAKENNLPMIEAASECVDRIINSLHELSELPIDPIMRESMISIVKGYSNWCAITPRFHHQNHPISHLAKSSSASSRLTSHTNQVTYLDEMNKNANLHPEPTITSETIVLEKEKKPYFKDVFKGYSSLDLRVNYYSELLVNHILNLIPFLICLAMNAGWVSLFSAFLIQQLATIVWTLSLHTLIHSHCRNTHIVDASDIILGLGYFGVFTPSIARYGHQTHHAQTETDEDFDYYFYRTNGIGKLLLKSTIFSEYYIMRYYQEKKDTNKTTCILIAKFALMIALYTILGNSYLWILLFSRIASSYLFASFTTLVHSVDMIQFFNQMEQVVNKLMGWKLNMDSILEVLFTYNIHVVKYHEYHHDYPWICPSAYCPTLTNLHPSLTPINNH